MKPKYFMCITSPYKKPPPAPEMQYSYYSTPIQTGPAHPPTSKNAIHQFNSFISHTHNRAWFSILPKARILSYHSFLCPRHVRRQPLLRNARSFQTSRNSARQSRRTRAPGDDRATQTTRRCAPATKRRFHLDLEQEIQTTAAC